MIIIITLRCANDGFLSYPLHNPRISFICRTHLIDLSVIGESDQGKQNKQIKARKTKSHRGDTHQRAANYSTKFIGSATKLFTRRHQKNIKHTQPVYNRVFIADSLLGSKTGGGIIPNYTKIRNGKKKNMDRSLCLSIFGLQ